MAFVEPISFCSIEEYERHEPDRIASDQLEADALYTYMTKLRDGEREASRTALRLVGKDIVDGLVSVSFVLLDQNLEDACEADGQIENDYLEPRLTIEITSPREASNTIVTGYLRDYFEDQFNYMLVETNELTLA